MGPAFALTFRAVFLMGLSTPALARWEQLPYNKGWSSELVRHLQQTSDVDRDAPVGDIRGELYTQCPGGVSPAWAPVSAAAGELPEDVLEGGSLDELLQAAGSSNNAEGGWRVLDLEGRRFEQQSAVLLVLAADRMILRNAEFLLLDGGTLIVQGGGQLVLDGVNVTRTEHEDSRGRLQDMVEVGDGCQLWWNAGTLAMDEEGAFFGWDPSGLDRAALAVADAEVTLTCSKLSFEGGSFVVQVLGLGAVLEASRTEFAESERSLVAVQGGADARLRDCEFLGTATPELGLNLSMAVYAAGGAALEMQDCNISGGGVGLWLEGEATAELTRLMLSDVELYSIVARRRAQVSASELLMWFIAPRPLIGRGVLVEAGAWVRVSEVTLRDLHNTGLYVKDAGSQLDVEGCSIIRSNRPVLVERAGQLSATACRLVDNAGTAMIVDGGGSHALVSDSSFSNNLGGVDALEGADVLLIRCSFSDSRGEPVQVSSNAQLVMRASNLTGTFGNAIDVDGARFAMEGCSITGSGLYILRATGAVSINITRCIMLNAAEAAVELNGDGGKIEMYDSVIAGAFGAGMDIRGNDFTVTVQGSYIRDCGESGIDVNGDGVANISDTLVQGHSKSGLLSAGGQIYGKNVTSSFNSECGVEASRGGTVVLERSLLHRNGQEGAWATVLDSRVTLLNCTVTDAEGSGVKAGTADSLLGRGASVEVHGGVVANNSNGLEAAGFDCRANLSDVLVSGNRRNGVLMGTSSYASCKDVVAEGNGQNGVWVEEQALLAGFSLRLNANAENGLYLRSGARAIVTGSEAFNNSQFGFNISNTSLLALRDSVSEGNGEGGLLLEFGGQAVGMDNVTFEGEAPNATTLQAPEDGRVGIPEVPPPEPTDTEAPQVPSDSSNTAIAVAVPVVVAVAVAAVLLYFVYWPKTPWEINPAKRHPPERIVLLSEADLNVQEQLKTLIGPVHRRMPLIRLSPADPSPTVTPDRSLQHPRTSYDVAANTVANGAGTSIAAARRMEVGCLSQTEEPGGDGDASGEGRPLLVEVMKPKTVVKRSLISQTGASAAVYKAAWTPPDEDRPKAVAVKEFKRRNGAQDAMPQLMRRELDAMKRFDHEKIISCYGWHSSARAGSFLLLEYMEGGDLSWYLHEYRKGQRGTEEEEQQPTGEGHKCEELERGGLTEEEAMIAVMHVAHALAYLHPGMVHGDVKPSNVLLDQRGVCKLADFGCVRNSSSLQTQDEQRGVGTIPYTAPEVFDRERSRGQLSHAIDLYSLGVLAWELLTGEKPWPDLDEAGIRQEVLNGKRPPMPKKTNCVLQSLITKLWSDRPEERLDASKVVSRLRQALCLLNEDRSIPVAPLSVPPADSPRHRERRRRINPVQLLFRTRHKGATNSSSTANTALTQPSA